MQILFIDDDTLATHYFRRAIENAKIIMDFADTIDAAWGKICGSGSTYDLIVLDLMMPPGQFTEGNADGLRTGLCCLKAFREKNVLTPVLILTNSEDAAVLAEAEGYVRVKIIDKVTILPSELPEIIRSLAADGR